MSTVNESIVLTPDQVISLVGHGVTQEQLDGVRRELSNDIKELDSKLEAKFDKIDAKIDANFTKLDNKIDSKFNMVLGFLLANVAGIVAGAAWIASKIG